MNFESILNRAISLVEMSPSFFRKNIETIRKTNYSEKLFFEPFRSSSTTFSPTYVRLAYKWEDWFNPLLPSQIFGFIQANNLIHESVHQMQRSNLGFLSFTTRYAQMSGRYALELEAYQIQIKHLMVHYGITDPNAIRPFIEAQAYSLANGYFLSKSYTAGNAFQDLMSGL